jgi:hypothetical protein
VAAGQPTADRGAARGADEASPVPVEVRREVLAPLLADVELLEGLTGESFADWKGDTGRGDFRSRQVTRERDACPGRGQAAPS